MNENTRDRIVGLPWLLLSAALPVAFLLYKVSHYGYTFPYWDEWQLTPFLENFYAGQLHLADLGVQHNEHRPFFPRLVMITLAWMTHWDVRAEWMASVVCAVLTFGVLSLLTLRTRPAGTTRPWWALPLLCWFIFSWVQMENWVWGWQLAVFMNVLSVAAGVFILAPQPHSPARFAGGVLLGIIATWSFANGLVYWFAVVPVFFRADSDTKRRGAYTGAWLLCAMVVVQLYFYGYNKPDVSPSFSAVLEQPAAFVSYVLVFLGAPITGIFTRLTWHGGYTPAMSPLYALPGFFALCFFGLWSVRALQSSRTPYARIAPWLALALYAGGSAVITAAGRVGFGLEHALTSRYTTITNLFWIALVGLLVAHPPINTGTVGQKRFAAFLALPLTITLLLCVNISQREWEDIAVWKAMSWKAVSAGYEAPLFLFDLSDHPDTLKKQDLPFLRAQGLAGLDVSVEELRAQIDAEEFVVHAKEFTARGMDGPARAYLQAAHFFAPEDKELHREIGGVLQNLGE